MTAPRRHPAEWTTKEIVIIGDSSIHPATHALVGAAAVAEMFSQLQAQVSLVSVVGEDPYGDEIINRLEKYPLLNLDGVTKLPYYPTTQFSTLPAYAQMSDRKHISLDIEQQLISHFTNYAGYADSIVVVDYNYLLTPAIRTWIQEYLKKPDAVTGIIGTNPLWYAASSPTFSVLTYPQAATLLGVPAHTSTKLAVDQLNQHRHSLLHQLHAHAAVVSSNYGIWLATTRTSHFQPYTSDTEAADILTNTHATTAVLALSHASKKTLSAGTKTVLRTAAHYWTAAHRDQLVGIIGTDKIIANRIILQQLIVQQKQAGKRIILTAGYFDTLRPHHIQFFEEARALGDILIVAVKTDDTLRSATKSHPRLVNVLEDRIRMLTGLQSIDYLFSFSDPTAEELVKTIKPDVYVKGGNYLPDRLPEAGWVKLYGGEVKVIPYSTDRTSIPSPPPAQPPQLNQLPLPQNSLKPDNK